MRTIAFVTNQFSCERIIKAAKSVAEENNNELLVVGILDSQYEINPSAVDFLFSISKENGAPIRILFSEDVPIVMKEVIERYKCKNIVTGMPSTSDSVVYKLWKKYGSKDFYTVDIDGSIVEVANTKYARV